MAFVNGDIVEYLTNHGELPQVERVDTLWQQSRDLRQDAVERLLIAMKNLGISYEGDEGFIAAAREHEGLTVRAWKIARAEALRQLYGSKKNGSLQRRPSLDGMLDLFEDESDAVFMPSHQRDRFLEALRDHSCEECFEVIEEDYGEELREHYEKGTKHQKQAICLLIDLQRRKELGLPCTDNETRQKLKYLRQQTGWKLRTTIL